MNIVLKDGTTYEILGIDPGKFILMHLEDMDAVRDTWASMTDENLSEFSVEEGDVATKYYDCSVNQIRFEADIEAGYIEVTFLLSQKKHSEEYNMIRELAEQVENLKADKEMLEECVLEMSEIVYA